MAAQGGVTQTILFSSEAQQQAAALLKRMAVEEKVGQLTQVAGRDLPGLSTGKPDDLISRGTAFPIPLAMASSWDPSEQADYDAG